MQVINEEEYVNIERERELDGERWRNTVKMFYNDQTENLLIRNAMQYLLLFTRAARRN